MSPIACPVCGALATLAARTAYCPQCGWNRDKVIQKLKSSQRQWPGFIVVVVGMFAWLGYRQQSWQIWAVFGTVLLAVLAIAHLSTRSQIRRLEVGKKSPVVAEQASPTHPAVPEQFRVLLSLPRPRPIRMKSSGRFVMITVPIFVWGIAASAGLSLYTKWLRFQSFAAIPISDLFFPGLALLLACLPIAMWRSRGLERELLQNGDIALARITQQSARDGISTIFYEFKTPSGGSFQGSATDSTHALYEGMHVPVFYDSGSPGRHVVSVTSSYEVALPVQG